MTGRFAQHMLGAAVALTLAGGSALASPITMSVYGIGAPGFGPAAGSTIITFDQALPSGVTIGNAGSLAAGIYQGLHSGIAAPPFADATHYYSTGIGTTTIGLAGINTYLGLEWGSVDGYNKIEFFNGAASLGSFTGNAVWALANGDQGHDGTFYVDFAIPTGYTSVKLTSTSYAFEVDNVAFIDPPIATPEPAAITLFGLGLAAFGVLRHRRRVA